MKKTIIAIIAIFMIMPVKANAVENGTDATNDPNAVMIDGGYSGFLYSPRIVLTIAHDLEYGRVKDKARSVGYPGKIAWFGQKPWENYINSEKIFWAPNFQGRTEKDWSRIDDFAVIVLERPMKMNNKVRIANAEDIKRYRDNRTPVKLVGYGRQEDRRLPGKYNNFQVYPHSLTTRILTDEESNVIKRGLPPGVIFSSDLNFEQTPSMATVCDGDSGAGYFVEEDGYRNYIGGVSSGWGSPNCGHMGFWDPNGSMSGISLAYRFMDLIEKAEKYVQENPYIEKTTEIAKSKAVTTKLLCIKNDTKKYFKLKQCPKGYKLIKKVA